MASPPDTVAERIAAENLIRKRAAARLGGAWIMVPLLFELICIGGFIAWRYVQHLVIYNDPWRELISDMGDGMDRAFWVIGSILSITLFLTWHAGRRAGIHCLHEGQPVGVNAIGLYYLATTVAAILVPVVAIGIVSGMGELGDLFERHLDMGMLLAGIIALGNLVPAILLGLVYRQLLRGTQRSQGAGLIAIGAASSTETGTVDQPVTAYDDRPLA
jgi:hypothetical protein